MKLLYMVPFAYGIRSRHKTIINQAAFIVLNIVPVMITGLFMKSDMNLILQGISLLLGYIAMYSVYEIGYIYNDIFTSLKEDKPSKWLKAEELKTVEENFESIIASRVCTVLLAIILLRAVGNRYIVEYVCALMLIYITYAFHNNIRGRWNILTNSVLQVLKYGAPLLVVNGLDGFALYLLIIMCEIGFLRAVEYAARPRMELRIFKKYNSDIGRVVYHFSMCVISAVFMDSFSGLKALRIVSVILLLFRSLGLLLIYKNPEIKNQRKKNLENTN